MKLKKIKIESFRNISDIELKACDTINILYGKNAQGKTNIIEAIWLFTGNQSFRNSKNKEFIKFDKEFAKLKIDFADNQRDQKADIIITHKKTTTLNKVPLKTTNELNGNFLAVVFAPTHLSLIKEGPATRRSFLDIAISQIKLQYKCLLIKYIKLIDQRNALLKNHRCYKNIKTDIEIWDVQIAKIGTIISIFRNDYIKKLNSYASKIYQGISQQKEKFEIEYVSTIFEDIKSVESYEDSFVEIYIKKLKESFELDIKTGFTNIGIHRDDIEIKIDGNSAKSFGSQGQQRSCVIALKLSEAQIIKKTMKQTPIMLLDDVMSELDENRQEYILNNLNDMQVFITCCDISNTLRLKKGKVFKIKNGKIKD